jgi:hypothetical protein
MSGHDASDPEGFDEASVSLALPAGTTIHPGECGFALPDGRYLRIYEDGVRVERPDGFAASGESHVARPQLFAHRIRVGGNPHGYGPNRSVSYLTATDVVVNLPDTLERADDRDLVELAHLIVRRIIEIELRIDLDDGDLVVEFAEVEEGERVAHVIDLTAVGPY